MVICYLLIGGNIGKRVKLQELAVQFIEEEIGKVVGRSSYYETEPWGFSHEQDFLNSMLEVRTGLSPFELLDKIHIIEKRLGRVRKKQQYSERTIDIDVIFYGDQVISSPRLIIPHARFQERLFAIEPMLELNPSFVHPSLNKTIEQIREACNDELMVKRLN